MSSQSCVAVAVASRLGLHQAVLFCIELQRMEVVQVSAIEQSTISGVPKQ